MANEIYSQLNNQPNIIEMLQGFIQNPFPMLMQSKLNVPQQFQTDPHGATQYLLNSGQITQDQLNQAISKAQQMGIHI
jgi:hypothetical protein